MALPKYVVSSYTAKRSPAPKATLSVPLRVGVVSTICEESGDVNVVTAKELGTVPRLVTPDVAAAALTEALPLKLPTAVDDNKICALAAAAAAQGVRMTLSMA